MHKYIQMTQFFKKGLFSIYMLLNPSLSIRNVKSGLAVQPNFDEDDDDDEADSSRRPTHILDSVRAHATQGTEQDGPIQRTITMYRDGFVVDSGPYRRLDDPANASFLMALAHGRTPTELMQDSQGNALNQSMTIGLIDKRDRDYCDCDHSDEHSDSDSGDDPSNAFQSFSGAGSSLGGRSVAPSGGIITPHDPNDSLSSPPLAETNLPSTSIQIRLINGKRLVAKVNLVNPVSVLVQHIRASGEEGRDPYVLNSGYPPQTLEDLNISIEAAGLKGAQVTQKKV